MKEQKDQIDFADALANDIDFARTLVEAAVEKTHFYLSNQTLLGPHREILIYEAQEIEGLLALVLQFLDKASEDTDSALDFLCAAT